MDFFKKLSIKLKLQLITALVVTSILGITLIMFSNAGVIQKNFNEYDQAAVESQKLIIMINRDMNYVSRLNRSILLGDNFSKNFNKSDVYRKNIKEHFSKLKVAINAISDERKSSALKKLVDKSESDTIAFINDGYDRMSQLESVDRSPQVLAKAWQGYKEGASPFANDARTSFKQLVTYQDEIRDDLQNTAMNAISNMEIETAIVGGVFLILTAAFILVINKDIVFSIELVRKKVELIEENSDLTQRIDIRNNDELGQLSESFNKMLSTFQNSIEIVSMTSEKLSATAEQVAQTTVATADSVASQQSELNLVATAMNEMTSTVMEVAKNANTAESFAMSSDTEAQEGKVVVQATIDTIQTLASEIKSASVIIDGLKEDSNQIGTILDVIKSIAEQTNLLALNAAIEAARAGEQGRGFAVVADEVRSLASRTQSSTEEIQKMIEKLQTGTDKAVSAMLDSQTYVEKGVTSAESAGLALDSITESVSAISDMNTQIATAAEEQSKVSEEININIVNINDAAEITSKGASSTSQDSKEVATHSQDLAQIVSKFKI